MANIFELFKTIERTQEATPVSAIVVGLGNPGREYENTRHNVGFVAVDKIASECGVNIDRAKFRALTAEVKIGDRRVLLMKPQTYMNLSGEAVREAAAFYKIPAEQVIVLCDDVSLAPGVIRIRRKGSAGGHNGLKSIIACLGGEEFPRVKIGVGQKPTPEYDLANWVLGKMGAEDTKLFTSRLLDIEGAVRLILADKTEDAMARYSN